MRKLLTKSTLAVAIVAASAAIGYISYTQNQNKHLAYANPLLEENLEALAETNNGRTCYVSTYDCKAEISTSADIQIFKRKLGFSVIEIGMEFDMSGFTKKYCIYHWYNLLQDEVECGQDCDCQCAIAAFKS